MAKRCSKSGIPGICVSTEPDIIIWAVLAMDDINQHTINEKWGISECKIKSEKLQSGRISFDGVQIIYIQNPWWHGELGSNLNAPSWTNLDLENAHSPDPDITWSSVQSEGKLLFPSFRV